MELSAEQYNEVFRYVEGEMNATERDRFERLLLSNTKLSAEVNFYRKLLKVSESLAAKTSDTNLLYPENNVQETSVSALIGRARKNSELALENRLKAEDGLLQEKINLQVDVGTTITPPDGRQPGEIMPANEELLNARRLNNNWRNRSRNLLWLAAALVTIIFTSIVIFRYQKRNESSSIVVSKNHPDINASEDPEMIKNQARIVYDSSVNQNDSASHRLEKKKSDNHSKKISSLATSRRSNLFRSHFHPDTIPLDVAGPLRKALELYQKKQYDSAIVALEKSKALAKRGVDESDGEASFYADYFQAQSYMALDDIDKAVPKLKSLINRIPGSSLSIKAQWYLSLAYLKGGELNNAEALLEGISTQRLAREYRKKAIKLIKELKESS